MGTGFYINPTSPEEAAEFLQSVTIEQAVIFCVEGISSMKSGVYEEEGR